MAKRITEYGIGGFIANRVDKNIVGTSAIPLTWPEIDEEQKARLEDADYKVNRCEDSGQTLLAAAWRKYRSDCRDLRKKFASPDDVVWPDKPANPA